MSNRPEPLNALEKRLGYTFQDRQLLKTALIHSSFVNERVKAKESNERLEFLGDAVLSLIVANYLYQTYPEKSEGELTDLRSALVRRETLMGWANQLKLGQHLYMGRGENSSGGRERSLNLASGFEAILAALFVERGFEASAEWLKQLIEPEIEQILTEGRHLDHKGILQKQCQNKFHLIPTYEIVDETGLEHERIYEIEVRVGTVALGRGSGLTKQFAQQLAAKAGLVYLESLPADFNPLEVPKASLE